MATVKELKSKAKQSQVEVIELTPTEIKLITDLNISKQVAVNEFASTGQLEASLDLRKRNNIVLFENTYDGTLYFYPDYRNKTYEIEIIAYSMLISQQKYKIILTGGYAKFFKKIIKKKDKEHKPITTRFELARAMPIHLAGEHLLLGYKGRGVIRSVAFSAEDFNRIGINCKCDPTGI